MANKKNDTMIGIVILNYNTYEDTIRLVNELQHQTIANQLTIVVVDNYSPNGSYEKLKTIEELYSNTILLQSGENRGYSAGNNIGLKYTIGQGLKYTLIVNPDIEIHQKDYIAKMVAKINMDSKIAVLGTDIVNVEGNHQNPMREVGFWEELFWFYELLSLRKNNRVIYTENHSHSRYCEKLSGCCFMIRNSFIEQIGFLDENTFLYCEEPILAKQVRQCGLKMFYMAELQAFHNHIKAKKGNPVKRMKTFTASRNYYLEKYSGYSPFSVRLLRFSRITQSFFYRLFKH